MKLLNYIRHPWKAITSLQFRGLFCFFPDKLILEMQYKDMMGKKLNLKNPRTFNEKLQWLKLYDKNPLYKTLVDKYEVKEYVSKIIGDEYIIPTINVFDRFEDIDFSILPNQFVIKNTNDSGSTTVIKEKTNINIEELRRKYSLRSNYFLGGREWPYKDLKQRIIIEQYMCDNDTSVLSNQSLTDYKFYCFDGFVDCVMICYDRASGDTKFYFFDKDWKLKRINKRGKEAPSDFSLPKPKCLDLMFSIASRLSQGIPFVRVDLYQSGERVFFGEMTFYPQSGFDKNYLPETDLYFGDLINLSKAYNKER